MATPGVGQDIEAMCGRCGQVWHVVMAKMGDRIAKVVCKRCGGHHRYRDENADAEQPRRATRRAPRRPTFGRRADRARARRAARRRAAVRSRQAAAHLRAARELRAGERVAHPTFGVGVVAGSPGAGKVEVVFPSGARVLACAKATSTLARPVADRRICRSARPPAEVTVTPARSRASSCASASRAPSGAAIRGFFATRSPGRRGCPTARWSW